MTKKSVNFIAWHSIYESAIEAPLTKGLIEMRILLL